MHAAWKMIAVHAGQKKRVLGLDNLYFQISLILAKLVMSLQ